MFAGSSFFRPGQAGKGRFVGRKKGRFVNFGRRRPDAGLCYPLNRNKFVLNVVSKVDEAWCSKIEGDDLDLDLYRIKLAFH
jgi:hypothetical protein